MRKHIFDFLNYLNPAYEPKAPKGLRVLAYHDVPDVEKFKRQLEFLKSTYSIIDIHQLKAHLRHGKDLPENALLITFDDGDISVYEKGLPLLKRMEIPAVLFVITELIDTDHTFWCRWVEKVYQDQGKSFVEARKEVKRLKEVPEKERKEFLQNLSPVSSRQLTSRELMELSRNNIYIGNHTHTHPMINNCSEEEIQWELFHSRREFNRWGFPGFSIFAYPNGNWDLRSEKILKENNIEMAFLFDHEVNVSPIHPLRISRIRVDADLDLAEFKVKVSGMHSKIMRAKKRLEAVSPQHQ